MSYIEREIPHAKIPKNGFKSLEQLAKFVGDTTNQWLWSWTEEKMRKFIHRRLDNQVEKVIRKVLGFSEDWGEWRVDHCNGRMSKLSDLISNRASTLFTQWIDENLDQVTAKKMTKKEQNALAKEYRDLFMRRCRDEIRHKAKRDADEFLTKFSGFAVDSPFNVAISELMDATDNMETLAETEL